MEVHIVVHAENVPAGNKYKCNEAFYTFVAVDQLGNPITVPELEPETDDEKKLFEGAIRRRQVRLVLGGKMKPEDAEELRALFVTD
jgi:acyl-CoA hydrolase